jgi:hypothetical protein
LLVEQLRAEFEGVVRHRVVLGERHDEGGAQ